MLGPESGLCCSPPANLEYATAATLATLQALVNRLGPAAAVQVLSLHALSGLVKDQISQLASAPPQGSRPSCCRLPIPWLSVPLAIHRS